MPEALGLIHVYKIRPKVKLPVRASDEAVGYDVYASRVLDRKTRRVKQRLPVKIMPGEAVLIGIGVKMAVPFPYQVEVRPRSGLASRHDIELSNSPGTIDPDFRGEPGVLLRNRGQKPYTIKEGDRIAQIIFSPVEIPVLKEVARLTDLPVTRRGTGGFGSTGTAGLGLGTGDYDAGVARFDQYFMMIVLETAALSDCVRGCRRRPGGQFRRDWRGRLIGQKRRYGCLITQGLRIIASGYNAQYPGSKLCAEVGCLRDEKGIPSGEKMEECRAVHAEQMAIAAAADNGVSIRGATMYCNAEPCLFCARMIAGSGIKTLVVLKHGYGKRHGLSIVQEAGIVVRRITLQKPKRSKSSSRRRR